MQLIEQAMQHHQAGQLDQAGQLYSQILNSNPKDVDALHLRSLVAYQQQDFSVAEQDIRAAIAIQPKIGLFHKRLGDIYQARGDQDNAYRSFKKALKLDSTLFEAHNNLGLIQQQRNKPAEAIKHYRAAIKIKPDFAIAFNNLANVYEQQGKWTESINHYQKAIQLEPTFSQALFNLGNVYFKQGDMQSATEYYQLALQESPNYFEAHYQLSNIYYHSGEIALALEHLHHCINLRPKQSQLYVDFTTLAKSVSLNSYNPAIEALLLACYSQQGINHQNIALLSAQTLLMKYAESSDDKAFFNDDVLHCMLRQSLNVNPDIEKRLLNKRKQLLMQLLDEQPFTDDDLKLIESIAIQTFNNEYVFTVDRQEQEFITAIETKPSAQADGNEIAVYCMYKPLYQLPFAKQLAQQARNESNLNEIIEHTLIDYFDEQQLKSSIESLTTIDDEVSTLVQQQYEDNPYPRWFSLGRASTGTLKHLLTRYLAEDVIPTDIDESVALVAGCGTGEQPLKLAVSCPNITIDAIDLSKTSLAYAMNKAKHFGLNHVNFMQADILALHQLDKQYSYIECGGVLHHLESPEAGLENLLHVTKPGGLLRLAVYSELGRRHINVLRDKVNHDNLPATDDNIRQMREHVIAHRDQDYCKDVLHYTDFYSMSGCRDLLFHCQEHQYTLASLKAMLDRYQLRLVGFMFRDSHLKAEYQQQFPDDPQLTDWASLEKFEQDNPESFSSMYQFFVLRE